MRIKNLFASNYKSFAELNVNFDDFTLIVGANAAGKSNLISLCKFIKDIMLGGLDDAVAQQGGIDYLVNAQIGKTQPVKIGFELDITEKWIMRVSSELGLAINTISYTFEISPNQRGKNYRVSYDELSIKYDCTKIPTSSKKRSEIEHLNMPCSFTYRRKSPQSGYEVITDIPENVSSQFASHKAPLFVSEFLLNDLSREKKEILLYRLGYFVPPFFSEDNLIKIYDFDPKKLKRPCMISAKKTLEEDGSNLAATLQMLSKSKDEYKKFISLLKNSLPFITELDTERNYDQSYYYKIVEKYNKKPFYSNFLSDGTANIIAIIMALYFVNKSNVIIIEEPERNLHPRLLGKVVQIAKDVCTKKQIIFTTHNPEILSNVDISNIRFIQRDQLGFSSVTEPENNERVQLFIKNELSIADLFIQDLLGD